LFGVVLGIVNLQRRFAGGHRRARALAFEQRDPAVIAAGQRGAGQVQYLAEGLSRLCSATRMLASLSNDSSDGRGSASAASVAAITCARRLPVPLPVAGPANGGRNQIANRPLA
jgi:hypothetical protein